MSVPSAEKRRAMTTVGLMAFGRKDYGKAEAMQSKAVKAAKLAEEPMEVALGLYNLGNTYIAAKDFEAAVDVLSEAADGCCFHEFDELAPLAFCNLGIALFHCGEQRGAFDALKVARDMFQAQNNLPGEAHVCDCLAQCHNTYDQRREAETAWLYALDLYDRITNPNLEDVRASGRQDIIIKMKHFGYLHG